MTYVKMHDPLFGPEVVKSQDATCKLTIVNLCKHYIVFRDAHNLLKLFVLIMFYESLSLFDQVLFL
jgi:hypothetical protein